MNVKTFNEKRIKEIKDPELQKYISSLKSVIDGWQKINGDAINKIKTLSSQNERMREALIKIQHLARDADEYRAVSEIDDICDALKEVGDE